MKVWVLFHSEDWPHEDNYEGVFETADAAKQYLKKLDRGLWLGPPAVDMGVHPDGSVYFLMDGNVSDYYAEEWEVQT